RPEPPRGRARRRACEIATRFAGTRARALAANPPSGLARAQPRAPRGPLAGRDRAGTARCARAHCTLVLVDNTEPCFSSTRDWARSAQPESRGLRSGAARRAAAVLLCAHLLAAAVASLGVQVGRLVLGAVVGVGVDLAGPVVARARRQDLLSRVFPFSFRLDAVSARFSRLLVRFCLPSL